MTTNRTGPEWAGLTDEMRIRPKSSCIVTARSPKDIDKERKRLAARPTEPEEWNIRGQKGKRPANAARILTFSPSPTER